MRAVIVASAGRSGTSATAGMMYHLGLPMGSKIFNNAPSNPKGFFVDHDLRDINFECVPDPNNPPPFEVADQQARTRWDQYVAWAEKRVAEGADFWGANCVLNSFTGRTIIDVLRSMDIDIRLVQTFRPLKAMAESLSKRDGTSFEDAKALQQKFQQADSRINSYASHLNIPIFIMSYNRMIEETDTMAWRLGRFIYGEDFDADDAAQSAVEFIDPNLRHHE